MRANDYETVELLYDSPEWLKFRTGRLGGSDAAAVLGISPYKSNDQLWREKKYGVQNAISNDAMTYGKLAEAPIVELFGLDHANEYTVSTHKDIVFVKGKLMASVDGLLTEITTGRSGILEVKTVNALKVWTNLLPQHYYTQILHYFNVLTDAEFAVLRAYFKNQMLFREFLIERADCEYDIRLLAEKELEFLESLKNDNPPARILPRV